MSRLLLSGSSSSSFGTSRRGLRRPLLRCSAVISHPERRREDTAGQQPGPRQAILLSTRKAHGASITAALVTEEGDTKRVITASLDKSVALFELSCAHDFDCELKEVVRLTPTKAPLFSLAASPHHEGGRNQVFCGNAAKSIAVWELPQDHMKENLLLNGHSGWVRSLATDGRWLFSSGCSCLRQWDLTYATPKHKWELCADKGDILAIAAGSGRVFTAGGDGSIRSYAIDKKTGAFSNPKYRRVHRDRATGLCLHKGFLYTVSFDGSLCCLNAENLEVVEKVPAAHEGARLNCVVAAADGFLYTGGDDKVVRRWQLGSLEPSGALCRHFYPVRALAAGRGKGAELLVSGDSSGELAVWKVEGGTSRGALSAALTA